MRASLGIIGSCVVALAFASGCDSDTETRGQPSTTNTGGSSGQGGSDGGNGGSVGSGGNTGSGGSGAICNTCNQDQFCIDGNTCADRQSLIVSAYDQETADFRAMPGPGAPFGLFDALGTTWMGGDRWDRTVLASDGECVLVDLLTGYDYDETTFDAGTITISASTLGTLQLVQPDAPLPGTLPQAGGLVTFDITGGTAVAASNEVIPVPPRVQVSSADAVTPGQAATIIWQAGNPNDEIGVGSFFNNGQGDLIILSCTTPDDGQFTLSPTITAGFAGKLGASVDISLVRRRAVITQPTGVVTTVSLAVGTMVIVDYMP